VRDVGVTVQENIDIIRRSIRWDVLQSESQSASHKIDDKRPFEIAVAISPHKRNRRSNRPKLVKNRFRANVAKMPDFICMFGYLLYAIRQTTVRVGENENPSRFFGFRMRTHLAL
jgi:hypothetical protein